MNTEVAKRILEVLESLKREREQLSKNYSKLVKDVELLANEIGKINKRINDVEELAKALSSEQEKHKSFLRSLNDKVSLIDSKLYSKEDDKKILSSLVYDLHNLKNEMTKEIELLKNKIVLLESKINMKKIDSEAIKSLETSINEIKDITRISLQHINAKSSNIYARLERMENRQKLHELMLRVATTNKAMVDGYLNEIYNLVKKVKTMEDDEAVNLVLQYFDDMHSFWNEAGDKEMAQKFARKRLEIQNL
jgi:chromosome segregation protein